MANTGAMTHSDIPRWITKPTQPKAMMEEDTITVMLRDKTIEEMGHAIDSRGRAAYRTARCQAQIKVTLQLKERTAPMQCTLSRDTRTILEDRDSLVTNKCLQQVKEINSSRTQARQCPLDK